MAGLRSGGCTPRVLHFRSDKAGRWRGAVGSYRGLLAPTFSRDTWRVLIAPLRNSFPCPSCVEVGLKPHFQCTPCAMKPRLYRAHGNIKDPCNLFVRHVLQV